MSSIRWALAVGSILVIASAAATDTADRFQKIYRGARPAVVLITALDGQGSAIAQGSGFLVSTDGRVVTNLHVLEGASAAQVKFADGTEEDVHKTVAQDGLADLAVLQMAQHRGSPHLRLAEEADIAVGQEVLAIGSPMSLESTASSGIISGIRDFDGTTVVQTTAPISPGSSGGPLLNLQGQVVGVTSFQLKNAQNLNFAVAARHVKTLLDTRNVAAFPPAASEHQEVPAQKPELPVTPKASKEELTQTEQQLDTVMKEYGRLKTSAEKIAYLEKALASGALTRSGVATVEMILGAESGALDRDEDALHFYEAALRDSTAAGIHLVTLYRRLCGTYVGARRFPEAIDMCKAAVSEAKDSEDSDTDLTGSYTLLGVAYERSEKTAPAIEAFTKAVEADGKNKLAYQQLVETLRNSGDRARLKEIYDKLRNTNQQLWREVFPYGLQ